jgi:hypothetical protein
MASKDACAPPNSADQTSQSRSCDECAAEMKHLGDLPSYLGAAAMRVFRCYVCSNVVSEEWLALKEQPQRGANALRLSR